MQSRNALVALIALLAVAVICPSGQSAESKRIVFVAGPPSHGYGSHAHYAGCVLLAKCLQEGLPSVETVVHQNGWPADPQAFDNADAIVVFADGGGGNPINPHLEQVAALMKKGVGLACLHYAVQVDDPRGARVFPGLDRRPLRNSLVGQPHVEGRIQAVSRPSGDSWCGPLRNRRRMVLSHAIPQGLGRGHSRTLGSAAGRNSSAPRRSVQRQSDGPRRAGMIEHVAWARQRPDGGRGFGFTGGHWHWNWAHDQFRKLVLNGIAWTAGLEIPPDGINSPTPSFKDLEAHQDFAQPADFDADAWRKKIEQWNRKD